MSGRGIRRHVVGVVFLLGVFFVLTVPCRWFTPVLTYSFLFGEARSGYVLNPPGLNTQRVVMRYGDGFRDTRLHVHASAGQAVVADYDVAIERGSLWVAVYGPLDWFQRYVYAGPGKINRGVFSTSLGESERSRLVVPVKADGYYEVWLDARKLTGSIDVSVTAQ